MKKETKYRMVYKCMRCSATVNGDTVSIPDGKPRFQLHGCSDGSYGIGMLTGFVREEVNGDKGK